MFQIDLKSRKPIYEQIVDRFKEMIITGVLKPDEKVPSVRDLARELAINPNTIQKAYKELENQGYFYSVAGRGNFAAIPAEDFRNPARIRELKELLRSSVSELMFLGCSESEILEALEEAGLTQKGGEEK